MCYACGFPSMVHARDLAQAQKAQANTPYPETSHAIAEQLDAPNSIETTNVMAPGAAFQGSLEERGDQDWIAVSLDAGETVRIIVESDHIADMRLRLMGAAGDEITDASFTPAGESDKSTAQLSYETATSGTYYILAESDAAQDVGTYALRMESTAYRTALNAGPFDAPQIDLLTSIHWQAALSKPVVSVYFAPSGYAEAGLTSNGFNAYEKAQIRDVMDLIERYIDLDFQEVSTPNADFRLILDTDELSPSLRGYMFPQDLYYAGLGVFNGAAWDRSAGGDLERGGFSYMVIAHELLHGLGLAHPHDTGGASSVMMGVQNFYSSGAHDLNQGIYTTMSYNGGYRTGGTAARPTSIDFGFQIGPMALDLAILQAQYGANETTGSGDDRYVLTDRQGSGTYWQTIWDTGGTDEIVYTGGADAQIDLRAATLNYEVGGGGYMSNVAQIAGGFTIAHGVAIENARTGTGSDRLTGNALDNTLRAGRGHDTLTGHDGDDTLLAHNGSDFVEGGTGDDLLDGARGHDTLYGGAGDDTLLGGIGKDWLYGGAGDDVLRGSEHRNWLWGEDGDDALNGGDLRDILRGGRGHDNLEGMAGDDWMSAGRGHDTLAGGAGDDFLNGHRGDDLLRGGDGNDTLSGGHHRDTLEGGTGTDILNGGAGQDTFVFRRGDGADMIEDFELSEDWLRLSADLWTDLWTDPNAAAALTTAYGSTSDAGYVLDFGQGDRLTFQSLETLSGFRFETMDLS